MRKDTITLEREAFDHLLDEIVRKNDQIEELLARIEFTDNILECATAEVVDLLEKVRRMEKYENYYYKHRFGIDLEIEIEPDEIDVEFDEDEDEDVYISTGIIWDGIHENEDC